MASASGNINTRSEDCPVVLRFFESYTQVFTSLVARIGVEEYLSEDGCNAKHQMEGSAGQHISPSPARAEYTFEQTSEFVEMSQPR